MPPSRLTIAVASALCGAVIWLSVAALGGRQEAWDSPLYWTLGLPLLCIAAGLLGLFARRFSVAIAFALSYGQAAAMLMADGPGSMLPLGLVLFAVIALPLIPFAAFGAWLGRRSSDNAMSD